MSRRRVHRGSAHRGGRSARHLVLLLGLGLFPIDTALTTETSRIPTAPAAQISRTHPLTGFTQNLAPPDAGGVDTLAA